MMEDRINMSHGAGGITTAALIDGVFKEAFGNEYLNTMADSTVVPGADRIAVTTDSFVIRPLFYKGGDIGRLAVCGTVNDLLMSGAKPLYITAGYILEEGMDISGLKRVTASMADAAAEAGVQIVAGDTKVVPPSDREDPGVIINTAGVGSVREGISIGPENIKPGDSVILSGDLGDHHAAILGARMGIANEISSDTAPLCEMIDRLMNSGITVHALRDVTRGGLATVLNEMSDRAGLHIRIEETQIPVDPGVREFAGLLGLDPLYMGNEGKCVIILPAEAAPHALEIIRGSRYGERAALIGSVTDDGAGVTVRTAIGGLRSVGPLAGEGLPRIC